MDNSSDNNISNQTPKKKCCCRDQANKLYCYDWLADLPESHNDTEMVEVQFNRPIGFTADEKEWSET